MIFSLSLSLPLVFVIHNIQNQSAISNAKKNDNIQGAPYFHDISLFRSLFFYNQKYKDVE